MTISDIVNSVYARTKTNSTSYPAADMLIAINVAYDRVASLILRADSRWQWEDNNNTDLPIATATITSSQQDYTLATSHLTIDRVEIKDSAGIWHLLTQIDQQDLKGQEATALNEYRKTTGLPTEYDVSGASVFLYPIPNYTQASSLKVYFTRGPASFTSAEVSTGTKLPGFNSLYHDLIPLWVAFDYATNNALPTANSFFAAIQLKEQDLNDFYGLRDRDTNRRLIPNRDSNR